MGIQGKNSEQGNVLLCVLCTIFIISIIGANVLYNSVTRFNASASQVRSWKQSLYAAEAGGDLAYAEIRKTILSPSQAFSSGWTYSGGTYSPNSAFTFGTDNLSTSATVGIFYYDFNGNAWYRIRAKGTSPVKGFSRVTMDDRMNAATRGDSLLRKIDFNYDHFVAAYGPNGDGANKAIQAVSQAQVTRRIELIAAPITPFEAAIKCNGTFYGLGDGAFIDSYSSANGAYRFAANNPSDPNYADSRSGNVEIGSSVANIRGTVYGNLSTNGGTIIRSGQVTGTIDNNVPVTIPPFVLPTDLPLPQNSPTKVNGSTTITPSTNATAANPTYYVLSSFTGNLTVNPYNNAMTYVAIHTTGDITGTVDVKPNVHLEIYFDGNINVKARDMNNESGVSGNLQFYGISPTNGSSQSISIASPGNFAATFYAPSADFTLKGNADVTGAVICKTFYGNGNTSWHYDRALDNEGNGADYRIASYVEDIR